MKNFGVKNPSSLDFVREKLRKTKLEIEKSDKGKEISLKRKNSCRKHLGVDYPTQLERVKDIIIEKRRDKYFDTFVNKLYKKGIVPLFSKEEYLKARNGDVVEFKCLRCDETFKYKIGRYSLNVQHIYCPNPDHKFSSQAEHDIRNG